MSLLHEQLARDLDLSIYDPVRGFAEFVTTPYGEVRALVAMPFVQVEAGELRTGDVSTPVLRMLAADAVPLRVDDQIVVRGDSYRVIDKQPSDLGETELVLRRPL